MRTSPLTVKSPCPSSTDSSEALIVKPSRSPRGGTVTVMPPKNRIDPSA